MTQMRRIVLLGCTGSIGTQTLDVVSRLSPDVCRIVGLAARQNTTLLAEQARITGAKTVVLTDESRVSELQTAGLPDGTRILGGDASLIELATMPDADTVVVAVSGAAALSATLAAVRAGKRVCIATKEVLVSAGELIMDAARVSGAEILPVDSEHSAIWQCLRGLSPDAVRCVHITASGGPFRTWTKEKMDAATLAEALNHPTWRMGGKITIDSATLMNKGLEVIEAMRLFALPAERVKVVVHPQSVVHSFVETTDGSLLAQLGLPDMRLPIQMAILHPDKPDLGYPRLDPQQITTLTFEPPDETRFPALRLARESAIAGGTLPAVLNAANESAVAAFLSGDISFGAIVATVESCLAAHTSSPADSLETVLQADAWARAWVSAHLSGSAGAQAAQFGI